MNFLVIFTYVYTFQVVKVGHANQVLPFDDDLHTWKNNSAHAQQSQPYNDILDVSGFLQSRMLLENFLISHWKDCTGNKLSLALCFVIQDSVIWT